MSTHGAATAISNDIVVGIDGSESALEAARWAAVRARAWNAPVRLVHAVPVDAAVPRRRPLAAAAEVVRSLAPDIPVTLSAQHRPPDTLLITESARARLIVLGSRGLGDHADGGPGSVAMVVSHQGNCPVVVVRGRDSGAAPHTGPIVAGIDGSCFGDAALRLAFEFAQASGDVVVPVHAWTETDNGEGPILPSRAEEVQAATRQMLAAWLASWRSTYPDVVVRELVVHDRPVPGLLSVATPPDGPPAQLLVVGSRSQTQPHGALLGSTSNTLLREAECPVAVVRPEQLDHARPARFRTVGTTLGTGSRWDVTAG